MALTEEDTYPDALFEVPPARFVEERNRLARDLARAGKKAEAVHVKALTKPPPSVFAVNQAVRRAPAVARALLESTDELRRAQADAGTADGKRAYQEAAAAQAAEVDRLLEAARSVLDEAGIKPGEELLERIANDLRWGALSAEARPALEAGRLQKDIDPPGFDVLAGAALRAPPAGSRKSAPEQEDRARIEELRAAVAEAERAEAQARDDERTAEVRNRRALAHVTALQDQLASARRDAQSAQAALHAAGTLVAERTAAVARARAELGKAPKSAR